MKRGIVSLNNVELTALQAVFDDLHVGAQDGGRSFGATAAPPETASDSVTTTAVDFARLQAKLQPVAQVSDSLQEHTIELSFDEAEVLLDRLPAGKNDILNAVRQKLSALVRD